MYGSTHIHCVVHPDQRHVAISKSQRGTGNLPVYGHAERGFTADGDFLLGNCQIVLNGCRLSFQVDKKEYGENPCCRFYCFIKQYLYLPAAL